MDCALIAIVICMVSDVRLVRRCRAWRVDLGTEVTAKSFATGVSHRPGVDQDPCPS